MTARTVDSRSPTVVRLTLALLRRGDLALVRELDPRRDDVGPLRRAFACSAPERRFARALLERKTNLWLLRADQRAFCGDFVLIDVSSPSPEDRATVVLELKRGERPRRVNAARHQVQNAAAAVASAARATGAIPEDARHVVWLGDPDELLALLSQGTGRRGRVAGRRADGAGAPQPAPAQQPDRPSRGFRVSQAGRRLEAHE